MADDGKFSQEESEGKGRGARRCLAVATSVVSTVLANITDDNECTASAPAGGSPSKPGHEAVKGGGSSARPRPRACVPGR